MLESLGTCACTIAPPMPERRGRMGKKRRGRQSRQRGDDSSSFYSSSSDGIYTEEAPATRFPDILPMIEETIRKEAEGIKQKLEEQKEELKEEINKIHRQLNELLSRIVPRTQLEQLNGSSGDGPKYMKSEPNQMQPPTFSLKIESDVGNTVEKGKSITIKVKMYDGGNPIGEKLKDGRPHPLASAKVMMVVLDGKFNDNRSSWSKADFKESIKTSIAGDVNQGIVSNCVFYLNGGTGRHSGATITENSGNRKVKLGVMVLPDDSYGEYKNERVLEGVSKESFLVRDPPRPSKKQKVAVEHFRSPLAEQAPVGFGQERNGPTLNRQLQLQADTNMPSSSSTPRDNTLRADQQLSVEPSTNRQPSSFSEGHQTPVISDSTNQTMHNPDGGVQMDRLLEDLMHQPIHSPIVSGQPRLQECTNMPSSTPRDNTLGAVPRHWVAPSTNQQPSSFSEGHHHISAGVQTPVISDSMNQTMHNPDGGVQTWTLDALVRQPIRSPIGYSELVFPVQLLSDRPGVEPSKCWNLLDQPMIQLLNLLGSVLVKICGTIAEHRSLKGELKNGLESIKREMRMIIADITEENNHGVTQERFLLLQELAYDIEDFIDGLWEPGASGPILTAIGLDPRPQDLGRIDYFKSSIESLRKSQPSALRQLRGDNTATSGPSAGSPPYTPEAELVGIAKPKAELLELLSEADGWQPQQLRVISIVGFRGLGKTALARALYDDTHVADAFSCRAWVVASEYNDAEDLLNKIYQDVRTAGPDGTSSGNLRDILKDNRYLVFIDDVQRAEVWKDIEFAFPNNGKSSRIIVTTSIHSVANACSSGRGYVYTMRGLDHFYSQVLFWRKVYGRETEPEPSLVDGSKSILEKCDGLPLALISVAKYLGGKGHQLTRDYCEKVGQELGYYLAAGKDSAFGEMERALMECFDSLPDHDHRSCLLSVSFFPRGHRINRKRLIRRWIAEGLTVEKFAGGCFDELIDRSIIEPVPVCNGSNKVVERYQVHSVMLEFIIHMSVSNNFINLIHKDEPQLNNTCRVRRLSVQYSSNEGGGGVAKKIDLSSIRSLTICSSYIFDFKDCKLLRVLDLEGCNGLTEGVLDVICKLWFVKYLSLRGSNVPRIPQRMGKLYDLETLDIRGTQVKSLPVEVIKLPRLAHLFGRFELSRVSEEMSDGLKKGSLRTLAGVVIDKEHTGVEQIMLHARKLSKVKIWYNATPRGNNSTHPNKKAKCINSTVSSLLSSLQKRFTGSKALDTLSIDSSDLSKKFLRSLAEASCAIRTIKLRGKLERLPDSDTLHQLRNLNKLHLISTGLSSEVLSKLQTLLCLEYLKLAEDRDGFSGSSFVVHRGGFPNLQRLCFEAPKLPLLQIEQGAMTKLTSLQLLCQEFADGLGVTGIEHLQRLDEVILYSSVSDAVMEAWKRAAIQHQNRPSVKKQQINDAA